MSFKIDSCVQFGFYHAYFLFSVPRLKQQPGFFFGGFALVFALLFSLLFSLNNQTKTCFFHIIVIHCVLSYAIFNLDHVCVLLKGA